MCPGHEPGMGTEQKPSWDKQGIVLSLTDNETGATNQVPLYPGQGQDYSYIMTTGRYIPYVIKVNFFLGNHSQGTLFFFPMKVI